MDANINTYDGGASGRIRMIQRTTSSVPDIFIWTLGMVKPAAWTVPTLGGAVRQDQINKTN